MIALRGWVRDVAPGLTPRSVLEKFAAVQMIDAHLPTTDGRHVILPRYTQPEKELRVLLDQMKLTLPEQPPPRISAADNLIQCLPVVQTFRIDDFISNHLRLHTPPNSGSRANLCPHRGTGLLCSLLSPPPPSLSGVSSLVVTLPPVAPAMTSGQVRGLQCTNTIEGQVCCDRIYLVLRLVGKAMPR